MILQLDPPIPLLTPKGKGLAHLVLDYGIEHDLLWCCFLDCGEIWCFSNRDVRPDINISLNRNKPYPDDFSQYRP